MSNDGESDKEAHKRIPDARWAWYKLEEFWKRGTLSLKSRLRIYNAPTMAKLAYALGSSSTPDMLVDKLNTFHLRGLRQLLGMHTAFVRRGNTNEEVLRGANERVNAIPAVTPKKKKLAKTVELILVSGMIQETAAALLGGIIRSPPNKLMRQVTLLPGSAMPKYSDTRRTGRPKHSWIELTMRRAWVVHEGWSKMGRPEPGENFEVHKAEHVDFIYRLGINDMMRTPGRYYNRRRRRRGLPVVQVHAHRIWRKC